MLITFIMSIVKCLTNKVQKIIIYRERFNAA